MRAVFPETPAKIERRHRDRRVVEGRQLTGLVYHLWHMYNDRTAALGGVKQASLASFPETNKTPYPSVGKYAESGYPSTDLRLSLTAAC